MRKEAIKALIELSGTTEEADVLIEEYTSYKDIPRKLAYITGLFDIAVLASHDAFDSTEDERLKTDYLAMLSTIINQKWR